jgi:hypothetical protein
LTLSLGLLAAGCSEELGPIPLRVTRVKGVVTEEGYPISGGWIEFVPVDGTVGNPRSARLHADGSFEVDKVAVGVNLIHLLHAPFRSAATARLFSPYTSPIRRVIPEQPGRFLRIDLAEEAIHSYRSQGRAISSQATRAGAPP